MCNIFIGILMFSIGCLLVGSSIESNAQSRPGMGAAAATAGYCPQGTQPKSSYGPGQKVPNVATDCVPAGKTSTEKQQKK